MGGVDHLDQNVATYMTAYRSEKCRWPIFRFCINICANNAFQIYRHQKENPEQKPLNLLEFRRSIVDTQIAMFPGSRKKTKVSDEVRQIS